MSNLAHIEYRKSQTVKALAKAKCQWVDSPFLSYDTKAFIFNSYVRPVLFYGMELLDLNKKETKSIEAFDHILLKSVFRLPKRTRSSKFYVAVGLDKPTVCLIKRQQTLHKAGFMSMS